MFPRFSGISLGVRWRAACQLHGVRRLPVLRSPLMRALIWAGSASLLAMLTLSSPPATACDWGGWSGCGCGGYGYGARRLLWCASLRLCCATGLRATGLRLCASVLCAASGLLCASSLLRRPHRGFVSAARELRAAGLLRTSFFRCPVFATARWERGLCCPRSSPATRHCPGSRAWALSVRGKARSLDEQTTDA